MAKTIVTAELVRALLDYDPQTGIFTRKVRLAQRHKAGDRADFLVKKGQLEGYHRISIKSQRFLAHRVAWLYVHGEWPAAQIDHKNQNKSDNRIENLRLADDCLNQQNIDPAQVNSKSGLRGAHFHPQTKKWRVKLGFEREYHDIGLFKTKEMAHAAYVMAKRLLQEGCSPERTRQLVKAEVSLKETPCFVCQMAAPLTSPQLTAIP